MRQSVKVLIVLLLLGAILSIVLLSRKETTNIKLSPGERVQLIVKNPGINQAPVYPIIDNDKCEQLHLTDLTGNFENQSSTTLNGDWNIVNKDKKHGYIFTDTKGNKKFSLKEVNRPDLGKYYYAVLNNQGNIYSINPDDVECWWKGVPLTNCQKGGTFIQQCKQDAVVKNCTGSNSVDPTRPYIRLKDYECDCPYYTSTVKSQFSTNTTEKKYVGKNCEYDDNTTCNSGGTANRDGSCTCTGVQFSLTGEDNGYLFGPTGSNCQYNRDNTCNNKGNPTYTGGCRCDKQTYQASGIINNDWTPCGGEGQPECGLYTKSGAKFLGAKCETEIDPRGYCNNHGFATREGNCECDTTVFGTFSGARCEIAP